MADVFMLDSASMDAAAPDDPQLAWLDEALAASRAPWKIVALHHALLTGGHENREKKDLRERLTPLLAKHRVDLVLWAGGPWYERLVLDGAPAVCFNSGWGGDADRAGFDEQPDPRVQAAYDRHPGFLLLEFQTRQASFKAITSRGQVIDQGVLTPQSLTAAPAR
jgi:acid phosphatase